VAQVAPAQRPALLAAPEPTGHAPACRSGQGSAAPARPRPDALRSGGGVHGEAGQALAWLGGSRSSSEVGYLMSRTAQGVFGGRSARPSDPTPSFRPGRLRASPLPALPPTTSPHYRLAAGGRAGSGCMHTCLQACSAARLHARCPASCFHLPPAQPAPLVARFVCIVHLPPARTCWSRRACTGGGHGARRARCARSCQGRRAADATCSHSRQLQLGQAPSVPYSSCGGATPTCTCLLRAPTPRPAVG
jgi:hypothetical protein